MSNWKATTRSGTEYQMNDGVLTVDAHIGEAEIFRPYLMKSVPGVVFDAWVADGKSEEFLLSGSDEEEPVIGERFYVEDEKQWRLSTPIKTFVRLSHE